MPFCFYLKKAMSSNVRKLFSLLGLCVPLDPRMRAHSIQWQPLGRVSSQQFANEVFCLLRNLNSISRVRSTASRQQQYLKEYTGATTQAVV